MNERKIKTLIPLAVAGDRNAFEEIYDLTVNYIYKTVYFLHDERFEVDDIVQEVFYQLFRCLSSFDLAEPFRPWLASITIKQVSEARRKKWKLNRVILKLFSFKEQDISDSLETVLDNDCYQQIIKHVEKLSPKLKEVVLLKYIHDFSQEQIAEILNIPIGTVKSRINSALTKLRSKPGVTSFTTVQEGKSHGY